jgi:hypothetical protein
MMPPPHDQPNPQLLPAYQLVTDHTIAPLKRRTNQGQYEQCTACYSPNKDKERFVKLLILLAILLRKIDYE